MSHSPVRVAVLGAGTVGTSVLRYLESHHDELAARVGAPLEVVGVGVRDASRPRPSLPVSTDLLTTDLESLVERADVVLELMGGIEPARSLLLRAMEKGASVVTANKALLGDDGPVLYETAKTHGVDIAFEAAVAGAIPLIRPIRVSLAGDTVNRVIGIVNGTTNYILDAMDRSGADLHDVLGEAQRLGYAEADPTADVGGHDAQAKAAILASLAFHTRVPAASVHREGILDVTREDMEEARRLGGVIKLLAIAERLPEDAGITVRVHPTVIPREHPLASVREAFNAVFVESDLAGELMFYGQGAGGDPTASAVLGDLVQVAQNKAVGAVGPGELAHAELPVRELADTLTSYAIRLEVHDRPGVLAQVTQAVAAEDVSIASFRQGVRRSSDGLAGLTLTTHLGTDAALSRVVSRLRYLDEVAAVTSVLRMEGF